ncbi:uncharacterized protein LOC123005111 [Tribolium madens]|uniref:uncharacterized protein LOC123005111 n=1 Tax=Tribolium madens TaxID=41895 RepID=UPI001CF74B97|nr:uncharacterized protein LOC123005111 [Tribolium madens]
MWPMFSVYYYYYYFFSRQTSVDISGGGRSGTTVTAGHQGTILDKNGYRLDGGAFASKQFHPNGPATIGGQLGYTHTPSGSNLNLGASHTQKYGTDLNLQGVGNLWRNGNSRLDAVGNYGRHYGGPGGTGRPNYYGGLQFNHRF